METHLFVFGILKAMPSTFMLYYRD